MTRERLAPNEWYHCYNRGVDKRRVYLTQADYERFVTLLYLCNGTKNIQLSDLYNRTLHGALKNENIDRGEPLVEIGVYTLMPNHVHLILKQLTDNGIAIFMQKVFTGYTMYFNKKHKRTGALFAGTFKSKHIPDDRYFKQVVSYVLLNPIELWEADWKNKSNNLSRIQRNLFAYTFSSFQEFFGRKRLENKIVGSGLNEIFSPRPSVKEMLKNAKLFNQTKTSEG